MPFERKRKPPVGIGITVRAYREEHDLSQEEFATMCGLTGSAISRIESGDRTRFTLNTLMRFSEVMDVTLDELVASSQAEAATA